MRYITRSKKHPEKIALSFVAPRWDETGGAWRCAGAQAETITRDPEIYGLHIAPGECRRLTFKVRDDDATDANFVWLRVGGSILTIINLVSDQHEIVIDPGLLEAMLEFYRRKPQGDGRWSVYLLLPIPPFHPRASAASWAEWAVRDLRGRETLPEELQIPPYTKLFIKLETSDDVVCREG